jgi:hypothetical protein
MLMKSLRQVTGCRDHHHHHHRRRHLHSPPPPHHLHSFLRARSGSVASSSAKRTPRSRFGRCSAPTCRSAAGGTR